VPAKACHRMTFNVGSEHCNYPSVTYASTENAIYRGTDIFRKNQFFFMTYIITLIMLIMRYK
jgi:hypothetical protein